MSRYRTLVPPAGTMVRSLRAERQEMLQFCRTLDDVEWTAPSSADGWRICDIVAHLGAGCHAMFTPASLAMLRSNDIEQANDQGVDDRRHWSRTRVMDEYERWSGRFCTLAAVMTRSPAARLPMPLAELGRYPVGLVMGAALVFDHHTHLRHDMAPALGVPAPPSDPERMSVVTAWMIAIWANQLRQQPATWLEGPVALTLRGPGGRAVYVGSDGLMTNQVDLPTIAEVTAATIDFPSWGTARTSWREATVDVVGNQAAAARLLDSINIV